MARYELRDGTTGELLSRHLTRSGAMDVWRLRHPGQPVRIVRVGLRGVESPVVEGVWLGGRSRAMERAATGIQTTEPGNLEGHPGTLRTLLDRIVQTSPSDWHLVPSIEPRAPATTFIGGSRPGEVQPSTHGVLHRVAVLRDDPGTALAWDFDPEPGRGASMSAFGGSRATSRTIEVRFQGSVVHRGTYLDVDRGTVYLPTPVREEPAGTFEVRAWDNQLLSLVNELAGLTEHTAYRTRLGLVEIPGHPLD